MDRKICGRAWLSGRAGSLFTVPHDEVAACYARGTLGWPEDFGQRK